MPKRCSIWELPSLLQQNFLFKRLLQVSCSTLTKHNRPFLHSSSVRTNNSNRARLGWTFSYIWCIFVHPDLDSVPLFVGMQERSIVQHYRNSPRWKRVTAWERSHAASGYGIIWGDADRNKQGGIQCGMS